VFIVWGDMGGTCERSSIRVKVFGTTEERQIALIRAHGEEKVRSDGDRHRSGLIGFGRFLVSEQVLRFVMSGVIHIVTLRFHLRMQNLWR
jgi:hypothetical protein